MNSETGHAPGGHPAPLRFAESPGVYVVTAVMLAAALVALLWVPSYAHVTPELAGIPFFYWYSILWLLINAILQFAAYQLLVSRRRRSGRGAPR
ncbi:MAG TPA: DUF3311 domain-containing protein [Acidimicrobiales bacterium]|jgi:hypothetical protein|nr:DUF3311 domain-containing protein [Acidimicrobiales bacterium]